MHDWSDDEEIEVDNDKIIPFVPAEPRIKQTFFPPQPSWLRDSYAIVNNHEGALAAKSQVFF